MNNVWNPRLIPEVLDSSGCVALHEILLLVIFLKLYLQGILIHFGKVMRCQAVTQYERCF